MSDITHLGMGIVHYKNLIDIDQSLIIPYLSSLRQKALEEDFTFIHDDNGKKIYAINRSGHRYSLSDVESACNHIMNFQSDNEEYNHFFRLCDRAMYDALLNYVEIFPMILPCLWWRTKGHVVAYGSGSYFGLHCDNDINYQPGAIPDQQLAIRNVVGCIIYFNNSVKNNEQKDKYDYVGGEIVFPYANVEFAPKAGDALIFPSNYLASHEVKNCLSGERYAYVGYFAQGSSDPERGINIAEDQGNPDCGQVWMPRLFNDYIEHINNKNIKNKEALRKLLQPTKRTQTSNNTTKEVEKEKAKND